MRDTYTFAHLDDFFEKFREKELLLTTKNLAEVLAVSTRTVARLRDEGLPYLKIRGQYRYERRKVIAHFEAAGLLRR